MTDIPVPCIVCKQALQDIGSGSPNHANDANSFFTRGQYGSRIFDPLDGSWLEVNICDKCLADASRERLVLWSPRGERDGLVPWEGQA